MKSVSTKSITVGIYKYGFVLSLIIAGIGCGGGTSSTSSGFDSGFTKTEALSALSTDDSKKLCEKTANYFDTIFTPELSCTTSAISLTLVPASTLGHDSVACYGYLDACLSTLYEAVPLTVESNTCADPANSNNFALGSSLCSAPVGLYEECIDEFFGAVGEVASRISCDTLDPAPTAQLEALFAAPIPPGQSCKKLYDLCPSLATISN